MVPPLLLSNSREEQEAEAEVVGQCNPLELDAVAAPLVVAGAGDSDGEDSDAGYNLMAECLFTFDGDEADDDRGHGTFAPFHDAYERSPSGEETLFSIALPPSLHPAASAGMRHVNSCYFSIGSRLSELDSSARVEGWRGSSADLLQLLGRGGGADGPNRAARGGGGIGCGEGVEEEKKCEEEDPRKRPSVQKEDLAAAAEAADWSSWNAIDVLYHDVMMRVFAFLPLESLASFSETSLRANFECFYFLQLQLQGALLNGNPAKATSSSVPFDDALVSAAGSAAVSRLASMDPSLAQDIVQGYLDSNSTLRTMPLSHSLAYLRHAIMRHGLHMVRDGSPLGSDPGGAALNGARAAALAVTLLGAASYVGSSGGGGLGSEYAVALRDGLLKIGLAGGLMGAGATAAAAAKSGGRGGADHGDDGGDDSDSGGGGNGHHGVAAQMRETAEQVARMLQEHLPRVPRLPQFPSAPASLRGHQHSIAVFPSRLYSALASSHAPSPVVGGPGEEVGDDGGAGSAVPNSESDAPVASGGSTGSGPRRRRRRGQRSRYRRGADGAGPRVSASSSASAEAVAWPRDETADDAPPASGGGLGSSPRTATSLELLAMGHPATPDPYEHTVDSTVDDRSEGPEAPGDDPPHGDGPAPPRIERRPRKKPSGCAGAYARAVRSAASEITRIVKERRRSNFLNLTEEERIRVSTRFVDACTSDDTLHIVRDLVQVRELVDVDGFYVGSDGAEACGLHAAAFHGAAGVVEFLCRGVGDGDGDGGGGAQGGSGGPWYDDGGACDVDLRDGNGWTATHFAAGADAVAVLRVLAEHRAELTAEAGNGYTPYHWAERLSNEGAASALRELGADSRFLEMRWMFGGGGGDRLVTAGGGRQPLSAFFAHRFFALMPSTEA